MAIPRWTMVGLVAAAALAAGCAQTQGPTGRTAAPDCPTTPATTGAAGGHDVHVRLWVRGEDAACVNVRLDDKRIVSSLVEPADTRLQPFIPRSFGAHRWEAASAVVAVDVPARALSEARTIAVPGDVWVVIEVREQEILVESYREDPYRDAD